MKAIKILNSRFSLQEIREFFSNYKTNLLKLGQNWRFGNNHKANCVHFPNNLLSNTKEKRFSMVWKGSLQICKFILLQLSAIHSFEERKIEEKNNVLSVVDLRSFKTNLIRTYKFTLDPSYKSLAKKKTKL